jgi:phage I-like protein
MVIDYEHQSLKSAAAPAAGWITKLIDRGTKGLWASVSWTQKAKSFLENREYRYFSPVFFVRKKDQKVIGLRNIALTNNPKTNNMIPLVASMGSHSVGSHSARWTVLSEDQRRFNAMMGIDDHEYLAAAGGLDIGQVRMFETDEEKIKRMLGNL